MLPHYSPLKVAETFSMLGGLLPRAHRPRARPRAGHRPETMFALQRDRRAARRPTTSPSSSPSCSPTSRTTSRPATRSRGCRDAARPARAARALAARLVAAERDLGGGARPALRVRRLHQPARRRDRARSTASSFAAVEPLSDARASSVARRVDLRRDRRGGRAARGELRGWRSRCCAAAGSIAVPPVEKALRFLEPRRRRADGVRRAPPAPRRRLAGTRSAPGSRRSPPSTAPTR